MLAEWRLVMGDHSVLRDFGPFAALGRPAPNEVTDVPGANSRLVMVVADNAADSPLLPVARQFAAVARGQVVLTRVLRSQEAGLEERNLFGNDADGVRDLVVARTRAESTLAALLRAVTAMRADVLAMHSRRAQSTLHHALAGSLPLQVLGKTGVPLLLTGVSTVVPETNSARVLVTTDGTPGADEKMVDMARWLIDRSFTPILFRVYVPSFGDSGDGPEVEAIQSSLLQQRSLLPNSAAVVTATASVQWPRALASRIIDEARVHDAWAIALSTASHSRVRHLLLGSDSMAVLRESPLPLLVVSR